jgi:hypothetical protein
VQGVLTGQLIACGVLIRDNVRSSNRQRDNTRGSTTEQEKYGGSIFQKDNKRRIIKKDEITK